MNRQYGDVATLPARLAKWVERVKFDKAMPWIGLGILEDMEAMVRLFTLVEFADWLRTHPDNELQRWAAAIQETVDERDGILAAIDEHLPAGGMTYEGDVEAAGKFMADVRAVLMGVGALAVDDTETDVPALLRALLS